MGAPMSSTKPVASPGDAFLQPNDGVAISFWIISIPLQMIEFNLILKAAGKNTSAGMFWKLLLGTVVMLACGYCGEISVLPAWPAFAGGLAGWAFILFEIFAGEAGGSVAGCSEAVASSFN